MKAKNISSMKARDIMSEEVITIQIDSNLKELALVLHENGISGAPVIDADGTLVGVVSESDLVRIRSNAAPARSSRINTSPAMPYDENDEAAEIHGYFKNSAEGDLLENGFVEEVIGESQVADIFTPFVVSAGVDTPVTDLASIMYEKRIHRLLIVEDKSLVGIVTTMDFLKLFAGLT